MKLKPLVMFLSLVPAIAMASSHREAPFISTMPQVDGSDFYMFMSYEAGHAGDVVLLANYNPLQTPGGGPNFYPLDPNAVYDINIDNNGSAKSALTFRFKFTNTYKNLTVPTGTNSANAVPLINIGAVSSSSQSALNRIETYTVELYKGDPSTTVGQPLVNSTGGSAVFTKPVDNIGNKSISAYTAYANSYVYDVVIPGCSQAGRVFVGQRKDGFVADLGEIFDLVNLNPLGARDSTHNALTDKNVDTLALEVPASCLLDSNHDPIIGGWTTASVPKIQVLNPGAGNGEPIGPPTNNLVQVSRLGQPLVNELVIGLPDKDKFNSSVPSNDTQFLKYVTNPTLPVLLNALFGTGAAAVPTTPRNDLVTVFLTGVPGLNQPTNVVPSEELRLNTTTPVTAPANQNDLGVLGGDDAGFPNGRRPYDDTVTIALRVMEGALCGTAGSCGTENSDPNNGAPYTDGARSPGATAATETVTGDEYAADTYLPGFPYLMTPLPGSPNGMNGVPTN